MRGDIIHVSDTRRLQRRRVNVRYILKNLGRYIRPYALLFVLIFFASLAGTACSLLGPQVCGMAIDEIKLDGTTDFAKIWTYAAVLVAVYIASGLLTYLSSIGMSYLSRCVVKRIRTDIFARLTSLPVSYFDTRQAGDIISVLSYDLDTLGESRANDTMMVLTSVVTIVGSLVMMLISAPILVVVFVVTIPLTSLFTWWLTHKVQPLFRRRSSKLGELNGFIEEIITGQKTTKAYGCEEAVISRFEQKNKEAVEAYTVAENYGTISGPSVNFMNNLSLALISVFGAIMYMNGAIPSVGAIASFVLYSRKFSGPINEIANLLMRFYDADSGTIKIDGKDITNVTRASLRRAFTMVLQDTWLFSGTIYENVAYGSENVTAEDVERVCKAAKIHSFISRLPEGYNTVLTDNAVNISKGQKQLITIARAMLLDSPMLILDEATSNVDTRTEQYIQQAMENLMQGRTCFVIAHRLSTIKHARTIIVMDHGDVVEQGTHEQLMAKGGYYSKLYYSQFETAE